MEDSFMQVYAAHDDFRLYLRQGLLRPVNGKANETTPIVVLHREIDRVAGKGTVVVVKDTPASEIARRVERKTAAL
jgi:hypothetical protein